MTGKQRTQTISKGLITTLIMTWLSLTCQHCFAMAQQPETTSANPPHEHCNHTTDNDIADDAGLFCGSHGSCISVLKDTNQPTIDHHFSPQGAILVTPISLPAHQHSGLPIYFQISPPDSALFLPPEYFTVQLK